MIVEVTKRDIKRGRMGNCARCPVALAVKRAVKSRAPVSVSFDITERPYAGVTIKGVRWFSFLPQKCKTFIYAFDDRGMDAVKPFKFRMRDPRKSRARK